MKCFKCLCPCAAHSRGYLNFPLYHSSAMTHLNFSSHREEIKHLYISAWIKSCRCPVCCHGISWRKCNIYRDNSTLRGEKTPQTSCMSLLSTKRRKKCGLLRAQEVVGHWLAAETDGVSCFSTEILQTAHSLSSQGPRWGSGSRKIHPQGVSRRLPLLHNLNHAALISHLFHTSVPP